MIGRMVDDMEQDILYGIGKQSTFRVFIVDAFLKTIGIGNDLKGIPLVFVMDISPILIIVNIPGIKLGLAPKDSGIPSVMGVQNMTKKLLSVFRNLLHRNALFDYPFITIIVVIKKLIKKCLHF
jgi:hypothetical protein